MPPATTDSLVIGATGVVGGYIMEHLARAGRGAYGFARSVPAGPHWIAGNLDEHIALCIWGDKQQRAHQLA